jgi:hypothetical protein
MFVQPYFLESRLGVNNWIYCDSRHLTQALYMISSSLEAAQPVPELL